MGKRNRVQIIIHCKEYEKNQQTIERFGHIKYCLPMIDAYVVEVDKEELDQIKALDESFNIEEDAHITAQMNRVNDLIECRFAHDRGIYGKGIGVAIVDTGICLHKDFIEGSNRVVAFEDFLNHRKEPYDDNGHGTHVPYRKTKCEMTHNDNFIKKSISKSFIDLLFL
jgi:serine protease AprX